MTAAVADIRVVVTGVGVVSPIGIGSDPFWRNLAAGRSGIGILQSIPPTNLPSKLAAEVLDFDPLEYLYCRKFLKVMSRDIQLGVSASTLAMRDAGLTPGVMDPDRIGVVFGAGRMSTTPEELAEAVKCSANAEQAFEYTRWGELSMGQIAPLWLLKQLPNMPACHVSIEHDARGPSNTITSREASALLALSEAVQVIQRGAADCMISGACGACVQAVDITKMNLFEQLSRREDDPSRACRPFDLHRDGTVVGEGAGAFVLERYEHAVARGAKIYAEILGFGAGCDGRGYANGSGGAGLVRAIQSALKQSRLQPGEIGHINAHGKGTRFDDLVEARALHTALGTAADVVPVTGLKSYFGHFDAGSGAVELVGSLLAFEHGVVPATVGFETPDPRCRLNVVRDKPLRMQSRTALSVNRTAMGQSAAVVLRAL